MINEKLKAQIWKKFRTQADFSMGIKENEPTISQVVRGRRQLSPERQKAWAEVLGCRVEDIFSADVKRVQNVR